MSSVLFWIVAAAVIALGLLVWRKPFLLYRRLRGTRLVTCPETHSTVAVNVNAGLAARKYAAGEVDIELRNCTRWPERHDCGQECLHQIEMDPEGCLVRTIVRNWYLGRKCVLCGAPFDTVHWLEHRPAVRRPGAAPVQWSTFRPEMLKEVFATYEPVCWNCYVSESLRAGHPELVTDR
jgi:hypothetical protein